MDASKNVFKPSPNHTFNNHKGAKKINRFKQVKLSVGHLFGGHENQNSIKNPQFKHSKPYPIHHSLCAYSFQLLGDINVGRGT
jgi:hypothetical protein